MTNMTICSERCRCCGDFNVGTLVESDLVGEPSDFVCGNCDRPNFEAAAEDQKARYLAGAKFDANGVH